MRASTAASLLNEKLSNGHSKGMKSLNGCCEITLDADKPCTGLTKACCTEFWKLEIRMSAEMDVIRSSASHRQATGFGCIGRRLGASGPHQPCKGANSRAPLQQRLFNTERSDGTVSTSNAALEHIPQDYTLPSEASSSQPATALSKLLPGVFQLSSITGQLFSSLRSRWACQSPIAVWPSPLSSVCLSSVL